MINKECKGCGFVYRYCSFANANITEECPCINCLVKIICREFCNERVQAREELREDPNNREGKGISYARWFHEVIDMHQIELRNIEK